MERTEGSIVALQESFDLLIAQKHNPQAERACVDIRNEY